MYINPNDTAQINSVSSFTEYRTDNYAIARYPLYQPFSG